MFEKLEVPILGIVENMSHFICPHCGERTEIFGFGGAEAAAQKLGHAVPGPRADRSRDQDRRRPGHADRRVRSPESPQSAAFRELASNVAARVSTLALSGAKRPTWIPLGVKA